MRRFILIISLILCIKCSYGQNYFDTDGLNNTNNIYLFTLREYCKSIDSTTTSVVYVRNDNFIGENWPRRIRCFTIVYLKNESDYLEAIRTSNGHIIVLGISPFEFKSGEFFCSIIPFFTTYNNNILNLSNNGALVIYFGYNNPKKRLYFKNKKWIGI
jgi:hypothetical protein